MSNIQLNNLLKKVKKRKAIILEEGSAKLFIDGKLLVEELNLEEDVLSCMIDSKIAITALIDFVGNDFFLVPRNQKIMNAILSIYAYSAPPNITYIAMELKNTGTFDEIGGQSFLIHLVNNKIDQN